MIDYKTLKLDQHFMIDKDLISRIVSYADLQKKDVVLEIGAGHGELSQELSKQCTVLMVEKDKILCPLLHSYGTVYCGDYFSFDLKGFTHLVANLPYFLCEGVFWRLLRYHVKSVLTVPLSFAKKLESVGKLALIRELFFDFSLEEEVSPLAFDPMPLVMSAVVLLKPRQGNAFLQTIFQAYDKTLQRALIEAYVTFEHLTQKQAKEKLSFFDLTLLKTKVMHLSLVQVRKLLSLLK